MRKKGRLYYFWRYLKHVLTAWNTTGEGIHSPYLFHLVSFVLRDENTFYAFNEMAPSITGRAMFRIVNFMTQHEKHPLTIMEVGEEGVLTTYLQRPDSRNNVTVVDADSLFKHARGRVDVAYVQAGGTKDELLKMTNFLLPRLTEKGVLVLEGIHDSDEAEQVWQALKADRRVTSSIDTYYTGMVFVDRHYLKRHYRVRIEN